MGNVPKIKIVPLLPYSHCPVSLMIGWEVFETAFGIIETKFNMYFDVIFSVISFWLIMFLKNNYISNATFNNIVYWSIVSYVVLVAWGIWARLNRDKEKNL